MSADLDAIAQCAELIADHSARAPNAPLSKEWIRLTIEQAIAQDRKTRQQEIKPAVEELERLIKSKHEMSERAMASREGRIKYLESSKEAMRKQLAQQSAALVVAKDALSEAAVEIARRQGSVIESTVGTANLIGKIDNVIAQIAEAPRLEPRALTSGEAVEAAIEALQQIKDECDDAATWETANKAITKLRAMTRAPSRTEREDTAHEVGGKGGV